jgi:hypothetical protein
LNASKKLMPRNFLPLHYSVALMAQHGSGLRCRLREPSIISI